MNKIIKKNNYIQEQEYFIYKCAHDKIIFVTQTLSTFGDELFCLLIKAKTFRYTIILFPKLCVNILEQIFCLLM